MDGFLNGFPHASGPWTDGSDVNADVVFLWRRRERERMVNIVAKGWTAQADPLARSELEINWPSNGQFRHTCTNQF